MMGNFINQIGEWNPQFMREIKGRLKIFPVLVTAGLSILSQVVIFLIQLGQYPGEKYGLTSTYCTLGKAYQEQLSILSQAATKLQKQVYLYSSKVSYDADKLNEAKQQLKLTQQQVSKLNDTLYGGKVFCPTNQINFQDWWRDHWEYTFLSLSVIFIFTLLVAGSYLLINNLAQEERRGTLNFIRLSPQSEASILIGKMIGVPILVYLFTGLAIPFHIISGKAAGIAFSHIFSYYIALIGACIFFFSAALLFGLATRFFGGFQPWLGAGAVLMFLTFTFSTSYNSLYVDNAAAWFSMFSPIYITKHLFPNLLSTRNYYDKYNTYKTFSELQFFHIPVGTSLFGVIGIHIGNYALWTYGIWQGLQRRFRNPNTAIINKNQSYWLVATLQVLMWGFTLQNFNNYTPISPYNKPNSAYYDINYQVLQNLPWFMIFNLALLFGLMLVLAPQRQDIQDWARYRYQGGSSRKGWRHSLFGDLLLGEKSPSLVAIGINLLIITIPIAIWLILSLHLGQNRGYILDWIINDVGRFKALIGVVMFITIMMIYTTIAQRMLIMKTSKRYFWAIGTVIGLMYFPAMIFSMINLTPEKNAIPWLLSTFPWAGLANANTPTILMALFAEIAILVFLTMRLTRQIHLAGESATKAAMK